MLQQHVQRLQGHRALSLSPGRFTSLIVVRFDNTSSTASRFSAGVNAERLPIAACPPWSCSLTVTYPSVQGSEGVAPLGLDMDGKKEALSLVIGTGEESAKFWLKVLDDLRNRGLHNVCVVCRPSRAAGDR